MANRKVMEKRLVLIFFAFVALLACRQGVLAQEVKPAGIGGRYDNFYLFEEDMDAVTVTARRKDAYKRMGKREKSDLIERFKQKLKEDFPNVECSYDAVSDYALYQDTLLMTNGHLVGCFTEKPGGGVKGKDTLVVIKHALDEYIDQRIANNIKDIEEGKEILGNREAFAEQIHKMLWGVSPYKLIKMVEQLDGKWDYLPNDANSAYITFRGNKGFMGIYKVEWKINFLVDRSDLQLRQMTESIYMKVSIPFGVKLDDDTLENINRFNIAYDNFSSFKFRRGYVDFKRNVVYPDGEMFAVPVRKPTSKSIDMKVRVEAKKREPLLLEALCNMEVR